MQHEVIEEESSNVITAMQSYIMASCGELETTKNKDSFKMSGFSNPANVDVSNLYLFRMSCSCFNLILNFV